MSRLAHDSKLSDAAGKVGFITDGDWVESKDQDPNGDVRLVQLADIGMGEYLNKSNRRMTMEAALRLRCTFLEPGDVLIARMPTPIGRACIFPGDDSPSVTVVDVCVLRVDESVAEASYAVHMLNAPHFLRTVGQFVNGTTRQRISRANLEALPIPLPSIAEQRRIAKLLDQANSLRRARRLTLDSLGTLPSAIFREMFGIPQSQFDGPRTQPLSELIKVGSGQGLTQDQLIPGPFPVYGGNGINGYHSSFFVPCGTVVIGRVGVYCGAVHTTTSNAWVTDNALIVSIKNPEVILPTYLAAALANANLNQYANRSSQPLISGNLLNPIRIAVPDLQEQQMFSMRLARIESAISTAERHLALLDKLFASLQDDTFERNVTPRNVESTVSSE